MEINRLSALSEAVIDVAKGEHLQESLKRLVENAVYLSGATYGALGAIGKDGSLEEFTYVGISEESADEIATFPEGKGLLGHLLQHPTPLRLSSIQSHMASSGFPEGHPSMKTFLGVPIKIRDEIYGSIYLTEKRNGEDFTSDDEQLITVLASAAGIAIDSVRGLEARNQLSLLAERERIARDLHDLVIQRLFATGISLQVLSNNSEITEGNLNKIREAIESLDVTVQQIRNTVFALQTKDSEISFRSRIENEISWVRESGNFIITHSFIGPIDSTVKSELVDDLIAVVRELLANSVKHSGGRKIDLRMQASDSSIEIQVIDDGIGYQDGKRMSGLQNLIKRAEANNGFFKINELESGGTKAIWSAKN